jgi:hypothetical protein
MRLAIIVTIVTFTTIVIIGRILSVSRGKTQPLRLGFLLLQSQFGEGFGIGCGSC